MDLQSITRQHGANVPARPHFGFAPEPAEDDPSDWKHLAGIGPAAREIAEAFAKACEAIDKDPDLTEPGRVKARRRAAEEHQKVLERQEALIAQGGKALEADAAKIKSSLTSASKGDAQTVALAVEYRGTLRSMNFQEREAEVLAAINARDAIRLGAIVGAMPESSGLRDTGSGIVHLARLAFVEAQHGPGAHERLQRYASTIAAAQQGVAAARNFIKQRIGGGS